MASLRSDNQHPGDVACGNCMEHLYDGATQTWLEPPKVTCDVCVEMISLQLKRVSDYAHALERQNISAHVIAENRKRYLEGDHDLIHRDAWGGDGGGMVSVDEVIARKGGGK